MGKRASRGCHGSPPLLTIFQKLGNSEGETLRGHRLAAVAVLVVALLAMMAPAFASGSGEKPPEITQPDREHDPRDPAERPATLPFTGSDLTAFVVVGAAAVGAGTIVVRRARTRSAQL